MVVWWHRFMMSSLTCMWRPDICRLNICQCRPIGVPSFVTVSYSFLPPLDHDAEFKTVDELRAIFVGVKEDVGVGVDVRHPVRALLWAIF